jgi:hypothetical protein
MDETDSPATGRRSLVETAKPSVSGVPISHHDRVIYPNLGISKIDLARGDD